MRHRDWEHRLLAWADAMTGAPFRWGVTDCHALALGAYEAMHGAALPAPTWTSKREALELMATGWAPAEALPRLGATPVRPGFLQRGDVVLNPIPESPIPGVLIALGAGIFLTSSPDHVVHRVHWSDLGSEITVWRWHG